MFKKHYSFLFLFVLSLGNRSFSQDLIHGSLKCTFKPENNWTQFVIWIEDESGKYIETVFITNFIGRRGGGNRISNPNIDTQTGNRLSALPIWAQKRGVVDTTYGLDNLYPPAASQPSYPDDMDAVSGATPSQNVQTKIQRISPLLPGVYNIRLEVNRSYDFNPYHNYSFYRGQPSLVWNTTFHVRDFADSNTVSDYLGYGSVDGSTGEIHPLDETITTAADLLQDMGGYKFKIVFTPENTSVQNNFQQFHCDNSYALGQNYPNPFNSATEIRYNLPKSCYVQLTVYDILGKQVIKLVDRKETSGIKKIQWDGRNDKDRFVASGIYIYKIQIDDYTDIKAMAYLK